MSFNLAKTKLSLCMGIALCTLYTPASFSATKVAIDKIFDDGTSHSSYPASNAADGSNSWSSRWAAKDTSDVNLTAELDDTT